MHNVKRKCSGSAFKLFYLYLYCRKFFHASWFPIELISGHKSQKTILFFFCSKWYFDYGSAVLNRRIQMCTKFIFTFESSVFIPFSVLFCFFLLRLQPFSMRLENFNIHFLSIDSVSQLFILRANRIKIKIKIKRKKRKPMNALIAAHCIDAIQTKQNGKSDKECYRLSFICCLWIEWFQFVEFIHIFCILFYLFASFFFCLNPSKCGNCMQISYKMF